MMKVFITSLLVLSDSDQQYYLNSIQYSSVHIILFTLSRHCMNFLNFLTAGASLFNFNLQNLASSSALQQPILPEKIVEPVVPLTTEITVKMKEEMEVLSQQQQLINQYMHLNIQLLSQKLQNLEKHPVEQKNKQSISKEENSDEIKSNNKKNKKINKCGHDDKQHYAKGLCNNCYHKYGRTKKPWNCPHEKLYAAGMCQNCYINNYNRKKRLIRDGQTEQLDYDLKVQESENDQIVIESTSKKEGKKEDEKGDQKNEKQEAAQQSNENL